MTSAILLSGRSGKKSAEMEETPPDYRPLPLTPIEGREAEKKPLVRERRRSRDPMASRLCLCLSAVSSVPPSSLPLFLRTDARARMQGGCAEALAMRLDTDGGLKAMTHSAQKSSEADYTFNTHIQ